MNETLKILESVNQFYSSSFSQLITITVAVLAFVGIFFPLLISYYQGRQLKIQKDSLERYIAARTASVQETLQEEIKKFFHTETDKFNAEIKRLELLLEKSGQVALAQSLHLQGNVAKERKDYDTAFYSLINAATAYALGGDEKRMLRVVNLCIKDCLPNMDDNLKKYHTSIEDQIEGFKVAIRGVNDNERYNDFLKQLELGFKNACTRKKQIDVKQ